MSQNTKIEWADHTFNPWIGCQAISPGCANCYAAAWAKRYGRDFADRTLTKTWALPKLWNAQAEAFHAQHGRRQRVFCASLADVFDNEVDPQWRADLFEMIEKTPNLDWLLLTKRIGNAHAMMVNALVWLNPSGPVELPLPNVWIGATVVNQEEADRDIPKLLTTPARVRFLSIEPMLGPVKLRSLCIGSGSAVHEAWGIPAHHDHMDALHPANRGRIDWVIAGGESGPGARPSHPDWYRSLRNQCEFAGVPFLFKQWGEWLPEGQKTLAASGQLVVVPFHVFTDGQRTARIGKKAAGRLLDGIEHNGFPS